MSPCVSKHEEVVARLVEDIPVLDKRHSGRAAAPSAVSSILMNQKYIYEINFLETYIKEGYVDSARRTLSLYARSSIR